VLLAVSALLLCLVVSACGGSDSTTATTDAVPIPAGQSAHTTYSAGAPIEQEGLKIEVVGVAAIELETIVGVKATNETDAPVAILLTPPDLAGGGQASEFAYANEIALVVPANTTDEGTLHFSPTKPDTSLTLTLHPSGGDVQPSGWEWSLDPA
jgi:hypothetical protein